MNMSTNCRSLGTAVSIDTILPIISIIMYLLYIIKGGFAL